MESYPLAELTMRPSLSTTVYEPASQTKPADIGFTQVSLTQGQLGLTLLESQTNLTS